MKSFIIGILGALLVLILASLIIPAYSDYTDRAITTEMLLSVEPIQKAIEKQITTQHPIVIELGNFNLTKKITKVVISTTGRITVQGGKSGQIFILTPELNTDKVTWQCVGGNYHAMPPKCKKT